MILASVFSHESYFYAVFHKSDRIYFVEKTTCLCKPFFLVAVTRFELVTLRVWTACSSQLSYTAKQHRLLYTIFCNMSRVFAKKINKFLYDSKSSRARISLRASAKTIRRKDASGPILPGYTENASPAGNNPSPSFSINGFKSFSEWNE